MTLDHHRRGGAFSSDLQVNQLGPAALRLSNSHRAKLKFAEKEKAYRGLGPS